MQTLIQGSVFTDPNTGESAIVYQHPLSKKWHLEANSFDAERITKGAITKQRKFWGYTKHVGYEWI